MNSNKKFFLGLSTGLLLGFVIFSVNLSTSVASTPPMAMQELATNGPVSGDLISTDSAATLETAWTQYIAAESCLASNTTLGGKVGARELMDVAYTYLMHGEENLKFRFYYTTDAEGNGKIGVNFYQSPSQETQMVLRTGVSSYCPVLCD